MRGLSHDALGCLPLGDFNAILFEAGHLRVAQALLQGDASAVGLSEALDSSLVEIRAHVHRLVGKGAVDYHVQGTVLVYFLTTRAREQLALREIKDTSR